MASVPRHHYLARDAGDESNGHETIKSDKQHIILIINLDICSLSKY